MAIDPPTPPADDADGVEPSEESGAGYGNHAPDDGEAGDELSSPSSRT